ncbi:hypothetical protein DFH06DRAFT_1135238 [Mycena polygramma]|nr:hypothetical protein DFH06DRAFT_1135238 [Mycena polygramma]
MVEISAPVRLTVACGRCGKGERGGGGELDGEAEAEARGDGGAEAGQGEHGRSWQEETAREEKELESGDDKVKKRKRKGHVTMGVRVTREAITCGCTDRLAYVAYTVVARSEISLGSRGTSVSSWF